MVTGRKRSFAHSVLNETMEKHGWIVTGVPGGAVYTVGLLTVGHPELAIHGMAASQANSLLQVAAHEVLENKYEYTVGLHHNVAVGYPAKVIDVHESNFWDWFGQALDYYEEDLKMRQLVWCDRAGKFPGDPLYDPAFGSQKLFNVRRPEYEQIH